MFPEGWINNDSVLPDDLDLTLETYADGTSFVAVDDATNNIVGACITGPDDPSSKQVFLDKASQTANKKWAHYLRLYARLAIDTNIYRRFNVENFFHVHCLTVNGDYRGRSIATKLVQQSFVEAAFHGYKVCSIYASNIYTERVAVKLKMELVSEFPMASIVDEDGVRLTYPPPPHTHIRTFVKQL